MDDCGTDRGERGILSRKGGYQGRTCIVMTCLLTIVAGYDTLNT